MGSDILDDFAGAANTYLNSASVSLMPTAAISAMNDFVVFCNQVGPDSPMSDTYIAGILRGARRAAAGIIGCRPEELVLTQSVTDGINMVSGGIDLPPGSNIVLRGGAHEYYGNYYPWLALSNKAEIRIVNTDESGLVDVRQLKEKIDSNTRLVTLSHVLYNTGAILPIEEIGEYLEAENIPFFVDAAQSVGCVSVDLREMRCGFMVFNGSKWLCGPMGTGFFYCRRDHTDMLKPIKVGGESVMLYDGYKLAPKDAPARFQAGFRNYAGMVGVTASMEYLARYGWQKIRERNAALVEQLEDGLARTPGVTIYGPGEMGAERSSILAFTLDGHTPRDIVERLAARGIILAVREIEERKIVRASPHFFNTEQQMQDTIDAIRAL